MINIKNVIDCKVAVIDKNGSIHLFGNNSKSCLHVKCLLDYLDEVYPSLDINKLKIGSPREYYGYIFGKLGNIIYFNDGKTGMFYFPSELTDSQIETLYNLDLGNQKVALCYDGKNNGNFINYRSIGLEGDKNFNEVFDLFLSNKRTQRRL